MSDYDAIVIGGGHNGLVAAGYLAKQGLSVLVLERRDRLGGPAGLVEWLPGYFVAGSHSPGSLEPRIVRDLDLVKHGLTFVKPDPTMVHPLDDGRVFCARRDRGSTGEQLDALQPGESERYSSLIAYLEAFAERLNISLFEEPPSLQRLVRELTTLADQEAFSRIFWGSATEFMDLFRLCDDTKAVVGTLAAVSGPGSPSLPGTVFNLLMRPLSIASQGIQRGYDPRSMPFRGSTGLPVGGMGAIIDAMAASVLSYGGAVRTESGVSSLLSADGSIGGVVTESGEEIKASIVISTISPKTLVMDLAPTTEEWAPFKAKMAAREFKGDECKVILALNGEPRWHLRGHPFTNAELASAQFRIGPSLGYLDMAFADRFAGRIPSAPVIWGLVPSMTSPGMAPPGHHVMSLNTFAPMDLAEGDWSSAGELMVKRCVEVLSRWIPDLPSQVEGYRCVPPSELETKYGLAGSEITHGNMLPGNMFWMRPLPGLHNYRTPTRGLYLSGAGTWPGNYVSGIPGHNTSQAVLDDLTRGTITLARPNHGRQKVGAG